MVIRGEWMRVLFRLHIGCQGQELLSCSLLENGRRLIRYKQYFRKINQVSVEGMD